MGQTYRLTPAAQRDLSSIWDYTEDRWGRQQAESYLDDLQFTIERVAIDPARGLPCDEIREGYRRQSSGSHLIFYKTSPDGVDIIRILHQRMDVGRHL